MNKKNNIVGVLVKFRWVFSLASILAIFLFLSFVVQPTSAKQASNPFVATISGNFWIAGSAGNSGIFFVEETGEGLEQNLEKTFTFTTSLFNDEYRIPPSCGPGSSTGVVGSGLITFDDGSGQIRLKLVSGTACFEFPIVTLDEQWVIASGTGNYVGVTGELSRQLYGNVIDGTFNGTFNGTIKKYE